MSRIRCENECSPFVEAFIHYDSISRPVLGASVTSQKLERTAAKANAQVLNIKALIAAPHGNEEYSRRSLGSIRASREGSLNIGSGFCVIRIMAEEQFQD